MSKSKKYFYLSVLLMLISLYFNTQNPWLNTHFTSIIKLILLCSIVNCVILLLAIRYADKSIKHLPERRSWIHKASKIQPLLLLIVLVLHLLASLYTFGII
ncbi:hypothetical protein [Staphylococcus intermedius]|uniref:Membrane protein n=1 Tax=Staphylococcus intermedius NCTC 11048 TaxID=1141106 RepID=A0A380G823_STAIN|nr:hypothetical protein [Staphylococcus intermedius]PCF64599.1 hypothetical protein B5C04_00725 [Staphylococcus intermedius]PCF80209.1 hypothetical protein B4W74_00740 [Staphylococcus intermedius]PCF81559.1 hypothetical protein B4W70_00725 [Staphylococcus intermedius]PCF84319.1 hypothetical protein B4W76_11780 [Staphylococcus intermedius]PCF86425.1 hypothetical protein B4W75_10755 [Staphylococcus intermedius]